MTDDIVILDNRGLRALERNFRDLGETVLGNALAGALTDVALESNRVMAVEFERGIKGGPEKFTQVKPGQRTSSVVERQARYQTGSSEVSSSLAVQGLQSTYLKYVLGGATERRPGDVGLADKVLFQPISANLRRYQCIELKRGNLPKGVLKKLQKRVADASAPPKLDRRGRPKPRKLKFGEVFYGRLRPGSPTGFWMRPSSTMTPGDRRPKLLLMAIDRQDTHGTLVPGWNRAVTQGAAGLKTAYKRRLEALMNARRVTP